LRCVGRPLPGMMVIEAEPRSDARGFFARMFCREELRRLGLGEGAAGVEQANLSYSAKRGTLRGLHYQLRPSAETKVVSCVRGALHDVVLDLRRESPAFGRWAAVELTAANGRLVVVPEGCAHGFLTLADDSLAFYLVSKAYDPLRERGVRWDDPAFGIVWPFAPSCLSDRDAAHPDFDPGFHLAA
jgi:dTDP-4-dehydrorhamnose 3,5-epimerase